MTLSTFKKEKLLLILLSVCCLLSLLLLLLISPPDRPRLDSLSTIDDTISRTLSYYQLPESQVRERSIQVDSLFTRNTSVVRVPSGFPSTAVHARIARELVPYGVVVEGERIFPENRLNLNIFYANRLVRVLEFSTDPDAVSAL